MIIVIYRWLNLCQQSRLDNNLKLINKWLKCLNRLNYNNSLIYIINVTYLLIILIPLEKKHGLDTHLFKIQYLVR